MYTERCLKLSMSKCHLEVKQVDFLGRTITSEGVSPQVDRVKNFPDKFNFPKPKNGLRRYIGFLNYHRNYMPRFSEGLTPFFKLLMEAIKFYISNELTSNFEHWNILRLRTCRMAL